MVVKKALKADFHEMNSSIEKSRHAEFVCFDFADKLFRSPESRNNFYFFARNISSYNSKQSKSCTWNNGFVVNFITSSKFAVHNQLERRFLLQIFSFGNHPNERCMFQKTLAKQLGLANWLHNPLTHKYKEIYGKEHH